MKLMDIISYKKIKLFCVYVLQLTRLMHFYPLRAKSVCGNFKMFSETTS